MVRGNRPAAEPDRQASDATLWSKRQKISRISALWQPDKWLDVSDTAGIAEAMIAHARLDTTPSELKARMDKDGITQLYYPLACQLHDISDSIQETRQPTTACTRLGLRAPRSAKRVKRNVRPTSSALGLF